MESMIITQKQWPEWKKFVQENIKDIDIVSFDLETNSVEEVKAVVWGIGLAFQEDEAYYLPLRTKEGTAILDEADVVSFVTELLSQKRIIAHNGVYDLAVWFHRYAKDLSANLYADTILMKHVLNEEPPFGLKEVSVLELGDWADKAKKELDDSIIANGGTVTQANYQMFMADTEILGTYCCWDVMLTFKLFNKFDARIKKEELSDFFYNEEVMPLYREVTIPMKYKGIPIDVEYFEKLKGEITDDIFRMYGKIYDSIKDLVEEFEHAQLEKEFPVKRTGNFPKAYAQLIGLDTPSLARKAIEKMTLNPDHELYAEQCAFREWLLNDAPFPGNARQVQYSMFFERNPERSSVFNINSKAQLKWLFFTKLGEKALSTTDGGDPQADDDFLKSISDKYEWVAMLQDLNKLEKIRGTYIEGLLDREHGGIIYTSFLQFGTTSGRYASRNPNLQNQPRPKEDDSGLSELVLRYNNAIRAGFVAPEGYAFVDADYSALEPRCFAHMSGDKNLQEIFHSGTDMYSAIAIRVFGLKDCSAFKKDKNFVGKLYPEKRQIIKALALAVTYGAEAFRISDLLKVKPEEAQKLIDDYLDAYPNLRKYIDECHAQVNSKGQVRTIFGRVRHLQEAKHLYDQYGSNLINPKWASVRGLREERRLYKNKLNNSTNFRIQGLAAHIVNRAMVLINREFRKQGIDGWVCLQVHDQVVATVKESQAEQALKIVQHMMENVVTLDVPLIAEPKIAHNLKESH